jgi:hypothetical protein
MTRVAFEWRATFGSASRAISRLRILSIAIALIGIGFLAVGGFAFLKTQEGYRSLNAFSNDGRYWVDFDRLHPIEGAARAQIWSPTAHALIGELGVGTATASALQLGLALAALFAGVGATFLFSGAGLFWATRRETQAVPVLRTATMTA